MQAAYKDAFSALNTFCEDVENSKLTSFIASKMAKAFSTGNKIMICGNGG